MPNDQPTPAALPRADREPTANVEWYCVTCRRSGVVSPQAPGESRMAVCQRAADDHAGQPGALCPAVVTVNIPDRAAPLSGERPEDTERLDWLESHQMTMRVDFDGACRKPWSVYYEQAAGFYGHLRGEGDTLREAIDVARAASPAAPTEEGTRDELLREIRGRLPMGRNGLGLDAELWRDILRYGATSWEEGAHAGEAKVRHELAARGFCSRCHQAIPDFHPPEGGMTAGYYTASGWPKYANPGEVYICDACMWRDPRYIADYAGAPTPAGSGMSEDTARLDWLQAHPTRDDPNDGYAFTTWTAGKEQEVFPSHSPRDVIDRAIAASCLHTSGDSGPANNPNQEQP